MTFPVAVVDPVPAYRKGLAAALAEIGLTAEEPPDVAEWLSKKSNRVVLLTLDGSAGAGRLSEICGIRQDVVVVAMLRDHSEALCLSALRAGASGVLYWDAASELIALSAKAAVQGYGLVPAGMLARLTATAAPDPEAAVELGDLEIDWLRNLAEGMTVTALAERVGYSEREMHRLLRKVYRKMDVPGRTAAMLKAARQGILG